MKLNLYVLSEINIQNHKMSFSLPKNLEKIIWNRRDNNEVQVVTNR